MIGPALLPTATLWKPAREDMRALLLIALIPILLALPQIVWLHASPAHYVAELALGAESPIQRGWPYIDPNNGFQTEALGIRAALDWVHGEVPWWNPYNGIGMPLAAEYQASAFFPLTLLLLLPRGMVLLQAALQVLSGCGTYCLLRQMGMSRLAATTGGVLYAVNGTLAWFNHGPASPVPFLPWMLLGIERARIAASQRIGGGWRVLAIAMAMSLLAGFPETAYINGLLALAWTILRGVQLPREARKAFAARIVAGGTIGVLIAAPQIWSFFLYLQQSNVAGHAGEYEKASLFGPNLFGTLIAPYFFGPIYGYAKYWNALYVYWGSMGGYASIALVAAATYGFCALRRDPLVLLLGAWTISTLCKSFGVEPFQWAWNLVPGVTMAAFARYVQPSWELALVIVACAGLESLGRRGMVRSTLLATSSLIGLGIALASGYLAYLWQFFPSIPGMHNWMLASSLWVVVSLAALFACIGQAKPGDSMRGLAVFLAFEAVLLCTIPVLSNPRGTRIDVSALEFLQRNLGLQRFYSTGPIQPNYGALFGIAQINHNYLPVPQVWVDHVKANLDSSWTDAVVFNGQEGRNSPAQLRANLERFQDLGVKYIVSYPHHDVLAGVEGVREVYIDGLMRIVELPHPRPYFETSIPCRMEVVERRAGRFECESPAMLRRRELHFDGWTATINGNDAPIVADQGIFQSISLPAGRSDVRFRYAPPHIGWAWLAAFCALGALVISSFRGARAARRRQ